VDKKQNKPRNLRDRVAKQELEPPRATYRNVKKLERQRHELVRHYQAKATGRENMAEFIPPEEDI